MIVADVPIIILAGGLGTRLRSVVGETPKVIAPIHGRPFLDYLIRSLYQQGVRKIILSLHFGADQVMSVVRGESYPSDLEISSVVEPTLLGTGGAVRFAYQFLKLKGPVFVCNGDTYFEKGLTELVSKADGYPSIGLVNVDDGSRYGQVSTDQLGFINKFLEKTPTAGAGLINMGLYFLTEELILKIPEKACSLEKDVFEKMQGLSSLKGIHIKTYFVDIGVPTDYQKFQLDSLEKILL